MPGPAGVEGGHTGRTGWMFPGQGSQRPGMAAGLESCRDLFATAKQILGVDLGRICTVIPSPGFPGELLQPALYTTSVGASRALSSRSLAPDAVLGHSLGEYAALTAAGSLDFEDGLRLVSARGRAMLSAARTNPGGMAAVIGLASEAISDICDGIDGVWAANLNAPNQTVISGRDEPLARAAEACRAAGAKRVVKLEVPIPGHCPLMAPAAAEVAGLLAAIDLHEPLCPFYSSVDAAPHTDPATIKELLVTVMTSPVRFFHTLGAMHADGVTSLVEVGPGRVLCGLVKHSLPDMPTASVGSDADAETYALVAPPAQPAQPAHEVRR